MTVDVPSPMPPRGILSVSWMLFSGRGGPTTCLKDAIGGSGRGVSAWAGTDTSSFELFSLYSFGSFGSGSRGGIVTVMTGGGGGALGRTQWVMLPYQATPLIRAMENRAPMTKFRRFMGGWVAGWRSRLGW